MTIVLTLAFYRQVSHFHHSPPLFDDVLKLKKPFKNAYKVHK